MYVIDASVYVSRLQATEVHHPSSRRLLQALQTKRIPVSCPTLLWPEVAAALGRGTQDPALARAAVAALRRLPFHSFIALDRGLAGSAADLAAQYSLRGADAVYVALAQRLNWSLVTLDEEQRQRAVGIVPTMTPSQVLNSL